MTSTTIPWVFVLYSIRLIFSARFIITIFSPKIQSYYYILTQSWSRALKYHSLYNQLALKHVNFWTLHGLWIGSVDAHNLTSAQYDYSSSPVYEQPKSSECLHKLNKVVPSLIQGSFTKRDKRLIDSSTFFTHSGETNEFRHEKLYNKHGKCSIYYNKQFAQSIVTPEAYLCKAADLAIEYNMGKYLRKFHVGSTHHVMDLSGHIKKMLGVTPYVHSLKLDDTDHYIMDQIYLYFDAKFKLIDYPYETYMGATTSYERCMHNLPKGETCEDERCKIIVATHPIPEPI